MGLYNCGLLCSPYGRFGHLSLRFAKSKPAPFLVTYDGRRPKVTTDYGNVGNSIEPIFDDEDKKRDKRMDWLPLFTAKDGRTLWANQEGDTKDHFKFAQRTPMKGSDFMKWLFPPLDHKGVRYFKLYEMMKGHATDLSEQTVTIKGYANGTLVLPYLAMKDFEKACAGHLVAFSTSNRYSSSQSQKNIHMEEMGFTPLVTWNNAVYNQSNSKVSEKWLMASGHPNLLWIKDCTA